MICKIQVSIAGEPGTLVYNKDRSFYDLSNNRVFGEKILGDDLKGYFKCSLNSKGHLTVYERVKDREW